MKPQNKNNTWNKATETNTLKSTKASSRKQKQKQTEATPPQKKKKNISYVCVEANKAWENTTTDHNKMP